MVLHKSRGTYRNSKGPDVRCFTDTYPYLSFGAPPQDIADLCKDALIRLHFRSVFYVRESNSINLAGAREIISV